MGASVGIVAILCAEEDVGMRFENVGSRGQGGVRGEDEDADLGGGWRERGEGADVGEGGRKVEVGFCV